MVQTNSKCPRCGAEHSASSELCAACPAPSHTNDNERPSPNVIAFSDLALAMQVNEDDPLRRLAEILFRRDDAASKADEAGG